MIHDNQGKSFRRRGKAKTEPISFGYCCPSIEDHTKDQDPDCPRAVCILLNIIFLNFYRKEGANLDVKDEKYGYE